MAGGDSLVAHPRGCRPRSDYVRRDTRPALDPILVVTLDPPRPSRPVSTQCTVAARMRHSGAVITRPPGELDPRRPRLLPVHGRGGRVLYVGKAKSLRAVGCPITSPTRPRCRPRTAQMVALADHVEWIQVANDVEAVMLEYSLIKRHRPRFNIRLVDDKSYPWLAVTLERRVAAGGGGPGEAPRQATATSVPTRTRGRSGARSTCCCGRSGSGPARTPSSTATSGWAPCLLYHIEKMRGPVHRSGGPRPLRRRCSPT